MLQCWAGGGQAAAPKQRSPAAGKLCSSPSHIFHGVSRRVVCILLIAFLLLLVAVPAALALAPAAAAVVVHRCPGFPLLQNGQVRIQHALCDQRRRRPPRRAVCPLERPQAARDARLRPSRGEEGWGERVAGLLAEARAGVDSRGSTGDTAPLRSSLLLPAAASARPTSVYSCSSMMHSLVGPPPSACHACTAWRSGASAAAASGTAGGGPVPTCGGCGGGVGGSDGRGAGCKRKQQNLPSSSPVDNSSRLLAIRAGPPGGENSPQRNPSSRAAGCTQAPAGAHSSPLAPRARSLRRARRAAEGVWVAGAGA